VRRQLAGRLLQSVIVVFIVTTISFFLIRLAPGEPFSYEGRNMSPAVRDQFRAMYGYDRPIPEQFVRYLGTIARGQFGYSHSRHRPVRDVLSEALPRTVLLMGLALALSFVVGIGVGALQAIRRGTWIDRALNSVLLFFYSVPDFWLALMLLLLFAYWVPIFPTGGMTNPVLYDYMPFGAKILDRLRHLILPAVSLTLLLAAGIARYQRASLIEVMPLDFVRTARAKGLNERGVVLRHALRNALLPIITLFGLMLPALFGGAFFVEYVFAWPGMGFLAATAIAARDYDLVTGAVIVGGLMVTLGSLVADVLYAVADPRLRTR
jgi:peptide/nickel transport system permease protein